MNRNKKMYSALVMTAAVALMTGTFAWLTQEADVTNKFATPYEGSYGSQIVETVLDPEGEEVTNEYTDTENEWELLVPDQFKPGDTIMKVVHFENTGSYDQLVRIKFNPELTEGLSLVGTGALSEQWVYDEATGYYYYKYVLVAGDSTDTILEAIKFDEEYTGPDVDMNANIYVKLETVQLSDENVAAISEFSVASAIINADGSVTWGF